MTILQSNQTSLFVQDYPGAEPVYLGDVDESCFNLDSIPDPKGGVDPIHCLNGYGDIIVTGTKRTARDLVSFTVENLLKSSVNKLERLATERCPFVFHALVRCDGKAGVFSNWIRAASLYGVRITDDMLGNVSQRDATDEQTHSFEMTAQSERLDAWQIVSSAKTTTETEDANTIHSFVIERCGGVCGAYAKKCDVLVVGCDAGAGVTANVLRSADGGNTWAATAADPFAVDEDILSIRMYQVGTSTVRILAARETDAANPMEVAYSDDNGATWTLVVLGATNGEFAERDQAIMALDENNIWVCTDQGNVYKSTDAGATFTAQGSALTASAGGDLNACHFHNANIGISVGDGDLIIYTEDGGTNWTAATATGGGNNLLTCWAFNRYRWIVGDDAGNVYQTFDGGVTWTEMTAFTGTGTGSVSNMKFVNELDGFMVHTDGSTQGRVLRTINGGYSWVRVGGSLAASAGLNAVHACDINHAFAVGDDDGTSAIILESGS